MASIVSCEPRRVVGGIDTHKDLHVAAVIDAVGRSLASQSFPATRGTAAHTTQRRVADGLSPLRAISPSRVSAEDRRMVTVERGPAVPDLSAISAANSSETLALTPGAAGGPTC